MWVPLALLAGIAGSALVAIAAALGQREEPELWRVGRGLLLQGFVTALVVGVGGTMLPVMTRAGSSPAISDEGWAPRVVQVVAAAVFLSSFVVEVFVDVRLGYMLRALVAGGVLIRSAQLWRLPSAASLHRRLIWIAAWFLPLGYLAAAIAPEQRVGALHVVFIGSFALMALSVSLHVALSHGGRPGRLASWPWQVWAIGLCVVSAMVFRLLLGLDPAHLKSWLALAAPFFLLATLAWNAFVASAIRAAGDITGS